MSAQIKRYLPVPAALILGAGLYVLSLHNYLLFHSLAEGFAVLVACTIFVLAWNCRRYLDNQYFLFLGIAFLSVGILHLAHAFAYKGMNLMPGYDANAPTQLWIATQYLASLSLLAAPLMLRRHIRPAYMIAGFGLIVLFLLLSILDWRIFPNCFIEGGGGLTPFKKISEYIISLIFVASGGLTWHVRNHFDSNVLRWLLLSIAFSVMAELSFTAYATVYGFFNMLGHYFVVISFYFMYKAVIQTGLAKPYDLLFRDLDQQRKWLAGTLEGIGDAVIAVDLAGRVSFLNPVASALTGWEPREALGRPAASVLKTVNELSREPDEDIAACVLRQRCVLSMANHTVLISRDGREIPIEDSAAPIKDSADNVIGVVIVFRDVTEKRQVRKRLLENESTYRAIAHNFPNGAIYLFDRDKRIHIADGQGLGLIGLSREALEGKTVLDHPLYQILEPGLERVFSGESFETQLEYKDRIRSVQFLPIRDEQEQIIFAMIVAQDVTDQQAINEQLLESEELYRELVQNANSAIVRWSSDGTITFFNEYAQKFFGYTAEEMIGKQVDVLLPEPKSADGGSKSLIKDIADHPERYSHHVNENVCRDGRRVWMNWTNKPIYDENGNLLEILTVGNDITESMRAREALQRSTERFELLSKISARLLATENPQDQVQELCSEVMAFLDCQAFFNFLVDEQSGKLHLNSCAGVPEPEIRKIEWLDFGENICSCVERNRQCIVAEDIPHTPDIRTERLKSYGIQAYCCHPLLIRDRLIGTLVFGTKTRPNFTAEEVELIRTVSDNVALAMQRIQVQRTLRNLNKELEQKVLERTEELADNYERLSRANAQLRARADQLRRLASQLTTAEQRERKRLSKILHDGLQQHLATARLRIGYFAEKLLNEDHKSEAREIEQILNESIQMSRSLSVELSPPVLHDAGLGGALEWLVRWMRDKHNFTVELSVDVQPRLPEDLTILVFESVRELLFNAVKHAKISWAKVGLHQNGRSEIRIVVSDEGVGFDPSRLDSTETAAGGLGLFSIRERIDSIGGRFEINSAAGKGCRLTMVVPAAVEPVPLLPAKSPSRPDGPREHSNKEESIRVLLADDHALFRDGIGRILNQEPDIEVVGYARDGREAIELARKLTPYVILMDINMPEVNGIEATRAICRESSTIRIIGLSMYEDEERSQAMLAAGAVGYKNKGCAAAELVSAIRSCVE